MISNPLTHILSVLKRGCHRLLYLFPLFSSCIGSAQVATPLDLMQKFAPDTYYILHIQDRAFVIKQDSFDKKKCTFTVYDVGDSLMVTPRYLTVKIKRNRFLILQEDTKRVCKKLSYHLDDLTWRGTALLDGTPVLFDFSAYTPNDYVTYSHRYQDPIFNYAVQNHVKYGEALGYWTSNHSEEGRAVEMISHGLSQSLQTKSLDLTMDIYLPKSDNLSKRPLLMFIHGGAFYIGDKQDNPIVEFCKHFASLGYVVASINYRMGFLPSKRSIERCGYAAVQDAHAAMRYLLEKRDLYRIDPDYLFVAGSSAGGITALNLAFMRNANRPTTTFKKLLSEDMGNIESSGNNYKQNFQIRAVGNMWGAVNDLSILRNAKSAIVSFHGDADKIVPYDSSTPMEVMGNDMNRLFFNTMHGSAAIHREAKRLHLREKLYTMKGVGHAPHVDDQNQTNATFDWIQDEMTQFFYEEFISPQAQLRHREGLYYTMAPISEINKIYWKIEGGFILETKGNEVKVIWCKDAPQHTLSVSALLKNGASLQRTISPTK